MINILLVASFTLLVLTLFLIVAYSFMWRKSQKSSAMKEIHEMLQVSKDIDKRVIHVENRMEEYAQEIESLKKEIKRLKSKKTSD